MKYASQVEFLSPHTKYPVSFGFAKFKILEWKFALNTKSHIVDSIISSAEVHNNVRDESSYFLFAFFVTSLNRQ